MEDKPLRGSGFIEGSHGISRDDIELEYAPKGTTAKLTALVAEMREVLDIERLAALEHEQWVHWTKYFLENLTADNISRWKKQIRTSYEDLSNEEKEADRKWARKIIQPQTLLSPTPAGEWIVVRREDLDWLIFLQHGKLLLDSKEVEMYSRLKAALGKE